MRVTLDHIPGFGVLHLLNDAGYRAYAVGGPVRNALLGVAVDDLDIATSAHPETVMALAEQHGLKAVPTGIEHGTVTVVQDGTGVEVTTFRKDVATDGRRAVVAFAKTIEEDAKRRDFTMNALYADASGQVHDPLGGLADLHSRRVRFIEDPARRIREDYLRILRFFRFFAWYGDHGQGLDANGLAACAELADGLAHLSQERVTAELLKLLAASDPVQAAAAMAQSGVLMQVLPGAHIRALGPLVHLEETVGAAPDAIRRLAALLVEEMEIPLRLSKKQSIVLHSMQNAQNGLQKPAELGYRLGFKTALDVVLLRAAAFETLVDPDASAQVEIGANAAFPLKAKHLSHLSGPALGAALKEAEQAWIASDFALDLDALVARSR